MEPGTEEIEASIDLLIADIQAHKDRLAKLQTESIWSVLYPEVL